MHPKASATLNTFADGMCVCVARLLFIISSSPLPLYPSCALHCGKPASPYRGIQKVVQDETAGASECESSHDRPGSSCHHVPSSCGVCLEPSLAWGRCFLCLLWPGRILLWYGQHHEPHHLGCCALDCVPQPAVT